MFVPVLEAHGLTAVDALYVEKVIALMKERVNFVAELWAQTHYFFVAPTSYDEKTCAKRWKEDSPAQLSALADLLDSLERFDAESTEQQVKTWLEEKGYPLGQVMKGQRLA